MLTKQMISMIGTEDLVAISQVIKKEISLRRKSDATQRRRDFIATLNIEEFSNIEQARKRCMEINASSFLALRGESETYKHRESYFESLMMQDWSELYPRDSDDGDFYVYAHVDPSSRIFTTSDNFGGNYGGEPFYIGKGIGRRAWDLKRNQGHGKQLKSCLDNGWKPDDIVKVAFSGLSEQKALEMEAKMIYFFGTIYEQNRKGILYNLDVNKRPSFTGTMVKIPTRKQINKEVGAA